MNLAEGVQPEGVRRVAAVLLGAAAAYLIVTDWISAPWSTAFAFTAVFTVAGILAVAAMARGFEVRSSWILAPLAAAALWGLAQLLLRIPDYRFATGGHRWAGPPLWRSCGRACKAFPRLALRGHFAPRLWRSGRCSLWKRSSSCSRVAAPWGRS